MRQAKPFKTRKKKKGKRKTWMVHNLFFWDITWGLEEAVLVDVVPGLLSLYQPVG